LICSQDRYLLAIIRNSSYCREKLFTPLWENFIEVIPKQFKMDVTYEWKEMLGLFVQLEFLVSQLYARHKVLLISRLLKHGIVMAGSSLMSDEKSSADSVTEIRSYVHEALLEMVGVHEEVTAARFEKEKATRMLNTLTERMASTFLRCVSEIDSLTPAYAAQLLVEVDFITLVLNQFLNDASRRVFARLMAQLEECAGDSNQGMFSYFTNLLKSFHFL
jgi:hypothetical protein